MPTSTRSRRDAALAVVMGGALASEARAIDRFEIEVYDGHANAPGVLSLENHVNFVGRGHRDSTEGGWPSHHQGHWTFEGALGATPVWEPGLYFQTALLPDGRVDYAGMKVRSKFVTLPSFSGHVRLGANFELASVPRRFDADRWSVEVRPIAAVDLALVRLSVNPILGVPLAHGAYQSGPHFEPAVSVKGVLDPKVALGVEYYGDIGPLARPEPASSQSHYVFVASDYDLGSKWELSLGVGYGLTGASDPLTFRAIVAYEFGRVF